MRTKLVIVRTKRMTPAMPSKLHSDRFRHPRIIDTKHLCIKPAQSIFALNQRSSINVNIPTHPPSNMRVTRIFEDLQGHESHSSLSQDDFIGLLAKHKALLLRSDEDQDPFNVEEFAETIEDLGLSKYEYVGGAGKKILPVYL